MNAIVLVLLLAVAEIQPTPFFSFGKELRDVDRDPVEDTLVSLLGLNYYVKQGEEKVELADHNITGAMAVHEKKAIEAVSNFCNKTIGKFNQIMEKAKGKGQDITQCTTNAEKELLGLMPKYQSRVEANFRNATATKTRYLDLQISMFDTYRKLFYNWREKVISCEEAKDQKSCLEPIRKEIYKSKKNLPKEISDVVQKAVKGLAMVDSLFVAQTIRDIFQPLTSEAKRIIHTIITCIKKKFK